VESSELSPSYPPPALPPPTIEFSSLGARRAPRKSTYTIRGKRHPGRCRRTNAFFLSACVPPEETESALLSRNRVDSIFNPKRRSIGVLGISSVLLYFLDDFLDGKKHGSEMKLRKYFLNSENVRFAVSLLTSRFALLRSKLLWRREVTFIFVYRYIPALMCKLLLRND